MSKPPAFKFLVVPVMHGGSRYFQQTISLMSGLHVPHVYETDAAFAGRSEAAFLERYAALQSDRPTYRVGLVLHEYGSCEGAGRDMRRPSGEVISRIRGTVEGRQFIQVVRDPAGYALSMQRHLLKKAFGWNFAQVGLPWFQRLDLLAPAYAEPAAEQTSCRLPEVPELAGELEHFLKTNLLFETNAQAYRESFPFQQVFDLSEFRGPQAEHALQRLAGLLSVEGPAWHPSFAAPKHSPAHFYMRHNPIEAFAGDRPLSLRLGLPGEELHEERPGLELVRLAMTAGRGEEGSGGDIGLFALKAQWDHLPLRVRNLLAEEQVLQTWLHNSFAPQFLANVDRFEAAVTERLPDGPSQQLRLAVWDQVAGDLMTFAENHGDVASRWHDPQAYFTEASGLLP